MSFRNEFAMFHRYVGCVLVALMAGAGFLAAHGGERIDWGVDLMGGAGSGDFAPSYISAMRGGRLSSARSLTLEARLSHTMDTTRRWSWAYGADLRAGVQNAPRYDRYVATPYGGIWTAPRRRPATAVLQQLYAQVKYRGVMLEIGQRELASPLLDNRLTSGDLIRSGNARPLPGGRIGFIDFQNIPLTRGWVQIDGELFYGRYTDSDWWADHIDRYTGHVVSGQWAVYRRCYFRTKPSERVSVTVGAQCASQFGGDYHYWKHGRITRSGHYKDGIKDFFKMFFPVEDGSEEFIQGNTIGSWDLKARCRLNAPGSEVSVYFQWPWEDGSGVGKLNGFDGLWGVEYRFGSDTPRWVDAVVVEYLDLTNQSGPIHWDPDDHPGTTVNYRAEGADDYYNNVYYNPYAVAGMSIGSPFVMAPVYNRDGYMQFAANRMRGVHVGVSGFLGAGTSYRMKFGYRKAWGNGKIEFDHPATCTSLMLEAVHNLRCLQGLKIGVQLGFDAGNLPADSYGALVTVSYDGAFTLGGKEATK